MSKYVCEFGHVDKNGQPLVHPSRSRCDGYLERQRQLKLSRNAAPAPAAPSPPATSSSASSSPPSSPPTTGEPTPNPAPARAGKGITVRYHPTDTTNPADPATPKPNVDENWEVTAETAIRFWRVVFSAIGYIFNGLCAFLQIAKLPKEVFEVDQGQEFVIKTNFRGFTTKILKNVFGAKSPEGADKIVAGLSGLMTFGLVFGKMALHLWTHLPSSPRIKKWKENAARRKEEKEAAEAAAREKDVQARLANLRSTGRPAVAPSG